VTNPRSTLAEFLAAIPNEKWEELIWECFTVTRMESQMCAKCGHRNPVAVPDVEKRVKAISELINQAHGAPAQTQVLQVDVTHRRFEELSDAELAAIAAGGEVVDGEVVEEAAALPPARPHCSYTKMDGSPCTARVVPGRPYCPAHKRLWLEEQKEQKAA
jgi:hypothetical protein